MLTPPTAYLNGYPKACTADAEAADNYIHHTQIGDPALDPVLEEIADLPIGDFHRFLKAGIESNDEMLRRAPEVLRNFFRDYSEPDWLDHEAFRPGVRAFHVNADLMLAAFVAGVLVEGFSTTISKSFAMTGRVASTSRRLRQNNRQLMEIFYPDGLLPEGDGWRLSYRVRFVHGRIRQLLAASDQWDNEVYGVPLHAANLGFAISVFSQRLLDYAALLGARFTPDEQASILAVWRYSGYLMGIPESILYNTGTEAKRIHRIALLCEPPPNEDSALMANALIKSIPSVAKITDPVEQRKTVMLAYRVSRALIGGQLADGFQYPKTRVAGVLFGFRTKERLKRWMKSSKLVRAGNFVQMLDISIFDSDGIGYRMPDHFHHEDSSPW
ncbi:MAG: oxygenase MpaB family protein [Bacteroidota bacterium]|nr:oxygenase MpaB family protein [Bacteroidota bacterium]